MNLRPREASVYEALKNGGITLRALADHANVSYTNLKDIVYGLKRMGALNMNQDGTYTGLLDTYKITGGRKAHSMTPKEEKKKGYTNVTLSSKDVFDKLSEVSRKIEERIANAPYKEYKISDLPEEEQQRIMNLYDRDRHKVKPKGNSRALSLA